MRYIRRTRYLLRGVASVPFLVLSAAIAYQCHAKPLTAGLVELVLVMVIAFRWGFLEAAIASIAAIACLDFFYMPPIFSLYVRDPQDWISSAVFAAIALLVSRFADSLRRQAEATGIERKRLERLYLTSRDILVMNRQQEVGTQLAHLIEDIFKLDAIAIWDARGLKMDKAGRKAVSDEEVRAIYFHEISESDTASCIFKRVLRLGVRPVGALYIAASMEDSHLDPGSADAIASLAALALERAHSFIAETNAEAAKRSEQLRSSILDGLAHAFKTPLATIRTSSFGLLELSQLGSPEKELVDLIEEQAERLTNLTNKVLQTAELDGGEIEIDGEEIYLDQLPQQCEEWFAFILVDHPLHFAEESSVDYVWADSHLLHMALLQLLDNAAKYSRPASPITLRIESTDTEVVFSVHNEGSYIAPHERQKIFERFYRSSEVQRKAPGTGIGLSVTRRIAEAHCGRVWVESTLPADTTFFLTFPHIKKEA